METNMKRNVLTENYRRFFGENLVENTLDTAQPGDIVNCDDPKEISNLGFDGYYSLEGEVNDDGTVTVNPLDNDGEYVEDYRDMDVSELNPDSWMVS